MKFLLQNSECMQTTYKLHTLQIKYGYIMATHISTLGSMATRLCIPLHLILCGLEDPNQIRNMARLPSYHVEITLVMQSLTTFFQWHLTPFPPCLIHIPTMCKLCLHLLLEEKLIHLFYTTKQFCTFN